MLYKAKTKAGIWIKGFLFGIYKDITKEVIGSFYIHEGLSGIESVEVDESTICQYVCKDSSGKDAFVGDYIRLQENDRTVNCILIKVDNGFSIFPNYQDSSLWHLTIHRGIGDFEVIGNVHDDGGKLADWLKRKDLWFRNRVKNK